MDLPFFFSLICGYDGVGAACLAPEPFRLPKHNSEPINVLEMNDHKDKLNVDYLSYVFTSCVVTFMRVIQCRHGVLLVSDIFR